MKKHEFQLGEWCLKGSEVVQVKEIDQYGYTVSTGTISTGTRGGTLYQLSLQNKHVADTVEHYSLEMHELCLGVNWPDLASWIEESLCAASENTEKQKKLLDQLADMNRQLHDIHDSIFEATKFRIFRN